MTSTSWPKLTETPKEKRCPKCGETKPAEAFGLRRKDGLILCSWCKECRSADQRKRDQETVELRWVDWRDMPHGKLVHDGEQRTMAYRRAHWREQVAALEQA